MYSGFYHLETILWRQKNNNHLPVYFHYTNTIPLLLCMTRIYLCLEKRPEYFVEVVVLGSQENFKELSTNQSDVYIDCRNLRISYCWGTWVAQSVKCQFSSDHALMVHEFEPHNGLCADSSELRAWNLLQILCLPLSLPLP